MTHPTIITAPILPGAFIHEVKLHIRETTDYEDRLLDVYIAAATNHFEERTGRTLYETEYEVAMDFWESTCITLPRAIPLISVTHIKYKDSDSVETTLDPALYVMDSMTGRIAPAHGESWPSFTPYPLSPIKIRYKAGLANTSPQVYVEDGMSTCIWAMVASIWEYREEIFDAEREIVQKFVRNPIIQGMIDFHKRNYAF